MRWRRWIRRAHPTDPTHRMRVFLKLGLGAMIALPPSCDAVPWRALQVVLACPCEYCVGKGNTVADCESFGSDCSCYRGCPCATCVRKGNTVADCESFGSDCSCYRDPGPSACADFGGRTATVNAVCCNEKTEDCSSGRPATCNLGCAHVLLPFFDDCAAALGSAGAALFDDVVTLCRTAEAPEFIYALGGEDAGGTRRVEVEKLMQQYEKPIEDKVSIWPQDPTVSKVWCVRVSRS